MTDEQTTESVIDRLLLALAAQLDMSGSPALAAGAVEALADLNRAEAEQIFGQAGHLVHYGYGVYDEPLVALMNAISAVQRGEMPEDTAIRPGDEVRLVGELPESLAGYDETWLRETVFVVRYVNRASTIVIQSDMTEDYSVATVPTAIAEPVRK